jgi:adenylate cyclase
LRLTKPLILIFILSGLLYFNSYASVDSLLRIWQNESFSDTVRSDALHDLTWDSYSKNNIDSMLYYADLNYKFVHDKNLYKHEIDALFALGMGSNISGSYLDAEYYLNRALDLAEANNDTLLSGAILIQQGNVHINRGAYTKAIGCFEKCFNIFEEQYNLRGEAIVLKNIGEVYSIEKNYSKALEYFEASLRIRDTLKKDEEKFGHNELAGYAQTLRDIGTCLMNLDDYASAFEYLQKSLAMFTEIDEPRGTANTLSKIGDIYMKLNIPDSAIANYKRSLELSSRSNDDPQIAHTSLRMGLFYLEQSKYALANNWCKKSLDLAETTGVILDQRDACECLYEANKSLNNSRVSLKYLEKLLRLDDSLQNEETTLKLQQMEFQKQFLADSLIQEEKKREVESLHKAEVKRKDINRNIIIATGFGLLIFAFGMYNRVRFIRRAKNRIEKEKNRSDNLLLNILPLEIAQELKIKGEAEARDYTDVTILFTDFKEFTQHSQTLSAKGLVSELNHCFKAFDEICEKYKIEKIKTIGDSFMAAGGIPVSTPSSVKNTVLAALEMNSFVISRKKELEDKNETAFEMRLGIHTGSVVAGIVGVKKFQYDIWGDSVNTASRMESNSEVGKLNISHSTYDLLKDDPDFKFIPRGKIQVKGKGEVEMYFVIRSFSEG